MKQHSIVQIRRPATPLDFLKLCLPILLFPLAYFPYTLWWRRGFALLCERLLYGADANPMRLLFTGNNTILFFWLLVTVVVMVTALVLSCMKLRPWYMILLYLAVMFSLCGMFSLGFYTLIVG